LPDTANAGRGNEDTLFAKLIASSGLPIGRKVKSHPDYCFLHLLKFSRLS